MIKRHLQRVLITGVSGTLGYNLVRHLGINQPDVQLHVLMRKLDHQLFADLPNVVLEQVDLTDSEQLMKSVADFLPNAIIHCAASGVRPSKTDYFHLVDVNVTATLRLFQASCAIDGCHFIQISTALVYAPQERPYREHDPFDTLHPYGASKAAADFLLRAAAARLDRHLTIVRAFSFTGLHDGGSRLFPSLLQCALDHQPFGMSPGTQLRDFCAVQDVVEAITLVLENGEQPSRDVLNVGSGLSVPLRDIVNSVAQQLGLEVEIQLGARSFHPFEPNNLVADITHAMSYGWRPKINLAYAVWQLARTRFPELAVIEPKQYL